MAEPWQYTIQERERWGDVDAAGIIFYGAYIRFFEIAETELFRSVGLPYTVMFEELDLWLPRRHLECDFLRPAKLDDMLEVAVCVGRVGTTSLRLEFEVRRPGNPELVATAAFVMVAVQRDHFSSTRMPPELARRLGPYIKPGAPSLP